jgi:hypothetical protein
VPVLVFPRLQHRSHRPSLSPCWVWRLSPRGLLVRVTDKHIHLAPIAEVVNVPAYGASDSERAEAAVGFGLGGHGINIAACGGGSLASIEPQRLYLGTDGAIGCLPPSGSSWPWYNLDGYLKSGSVCISRSVLPTANRVSLFYDHHAILKLKYAPEENCMRVMVDKLESRSTVFIYDLYCRAVEVAIPLGWPFDSPL